MDIDLALKLLQKHQGYALWHSGSSAWALHNRITTFENLPKDHACIHPWRIMVIQVFN